MNIKSKDMFFAAAVFLQGTNLFLNIILNGGGHESAAGFLAAGAAVGAVLFFLRKRAGEKQGKAAEIFFILFFTLYAAFNINLLSSFIGEYVLDETPKKVFVFFFILLCVYSGTKGVENLFRLSAVFFVLAVLSDVTNLFLLRDKIQFTNFMPFFVTPVKQHIIVFLKSFVLLFCDIIIFLCLPRKGTKHITAGFCTGVFLLLLIILRTTATLGNMMPLYTWPTHEALRIINSGNTLARIETSSVFVMLFMMFFKTSMLFCVAADKIKMRSGAKTRFIPSVAVGIIAYFIAVNISLPFLFLSLR